MQNLTDATFQDFVNYYKGLVSSSCSNSQANVKAIIEQKEKGNLFNKTMLTLGQTFLAGIGLAKQYEMLRKQGDLFEAQKDIGLRNIALAEKTFAETFMPSYKMGMDYWEKVYRKSFEPVISKMIDCGTRVCEYTADYERHKVRVLADVAKVINAAKLANRRSQDCYSIGACFDNDYRFADLQARMVVDASNLGRAYEEDLKLKKDTFYWNRMVTSAQAAQNLGSLASNILQYGKGSIVNGLQTLNQAAQGFDAAVGSGFSALSNAGNFYGGLPNTAGRLFGRESGQQIGQAILSQNVTQPLPSTAQWSTPNYPNMGADDGFNISAPILGNGTVPNVLLIGNNT